MKLGIQNVPVVWHGLSGDQEPMKGFCLSVFQNIMMKNVIRIKEAGSTIKQTWRRYKDFKTYQETIKTRNVLVLLPGLSSHTTACVIGEAVTNY
jgi:hypothetical protein